MISPRVVTARWFLLCVLAFGLVGMHHLGWLSHTSGTPVPVVSIVPGSMAHLAPTPDHQDVTPHGHGTHHGTGGLLHLCLAVLAAGLMLAGLWSQWRRPARAPGDTRLVPRAAWPRPAHPPPVPSSLLTSLGVLRL